MNEEKPFEYQEPTGAVRHLRKAWGPLMPGPSSSESYPATAADIIAALLAAPAERMAVLSEMPEYAELRDYGATLAQRRQATLDSAAEQRAADAERALSLVENPTCCGEWLSGSGGHRKFGGCGKPASWVEHGTGAAFCDEHGPRFHPPTSRGRSISTARPLTAADLLPTSEPAPEVLCHLWDKCARPRGHEGQCVDLWKGRCRADLDWPRRPHTSEPAPATTESTAHSWQSDGTHSVCARCGVYDFRGERDKAPPCKPRPTESPAEVSHEQAREAAYLLRDGGNPGEHAAADLLLRYIGKCEARQQQAEREVAAFQERLRIEKRDHQNTWDKLKRVQENVAGLNAAVQNDHKTRAALTQCNMTLAAAEARVAELEVHAERVQKDALRIALEELTEKTRAIVSERNALQARVEELLASYPDACDKFQDQIRKVAAERDELQAKVAELESRNEIAERHLYNIGATRGDVATRAETARRIYDAHLSDEVMLRERLEEVADELAKEGHERNGPADYVSIAEQLRAALAGRDCDSTQQGAKSDVGESAAPLTKADVRAIIADAATKAAEACGTSAHGYPLAKLAEAAKEEM